MDDLVCLVNCAKGPMASTIIGSIIWEAHSPAPSLNAVNPEVGRTPSFKAKIRIKIIPNQNIGMDIPILAKKEITESIAVPLFFAATIPSTTPNTTARINAGKTIDKVTFRRWNKIVEISACIATERPISPRNSP